MADNTLEQIDAKVSALLAIVLDAHLRASGVAKPRARSIDRLLTDVGLSPTAIAALLGKTERAVYLQLQRESSKKTKQKGDASDAES